MSMKKNPIPKVTKLDARKEYHCLSSLSQLVSDAVVVSMMNGDKVTLAFDALVNYIILQKNKLSTIHLHSQSLLTSTLGTTGSFKASKARHLGFDHF